MKKILLIIFLFLFNFQFCLAQNEITFIYLNGSNTNTQKSEEDFIKGVKRLHSHILTNFNNDEFINEKILQNGKYTINPEPKIFYWGSFSKEEIQAIEEDFDFLKAISPKPANYVRQFIALCLHDAIWVSRMENMYPILVELHKDILEEYKKGNKVVLLGYSAGTFIVHQYVFLKAPAVDLKNSIMDNDMDYKFKKYLADKKLNSTCADAIFKSGLVEYDVNNTFVFEDNFDVFKAQVDDLDNDTKNYCAPDDVLLGGINFASPFALFYSDIFNKNYKISEAMSLSYKYIVENNMFWLTVNYSDDPLGFPLSKNVTFDEVSKLTEQKITPNGGFIYDKSDESSRRTFVMAHLSYFNTAKRYSKILTRAFKEGFNHFYMTESE